MSKYHNLAQTLQGAIAAGEYPAGTRLPTIPKLCDLYGVSNTTVKKALDELDKLGIVARRRGSGIYVKSTPMLRGSKQPGWSMSGQMMGLTAEFARKGREVQSDVVEFSVIHPNAIVAESLDIGTEKFVYYICRVRLSEGAPQNVEYTFMPIDLIPGLLEEHLHGSVYSYIEDGLHLRIGSAHRILRAVTSTADEQEWLHVAPGEPLFEVRQVGFLDDGTPFEYSTTRHVSSYEFYVVSTH